MLPVSQQNNKTDGNQIRDYFSLYFWTGEALSFTPGGKPGVLRYTIRGKTLRGEDLHKRGDNA